MITYALDSNTVSYLLRGEGKVDEHFQQEIADGNMYAIPLIVFYEVRRWLLYKQNRPLRTLSEDFNALFGNVYSKSMMPIEVWEKAVDIHISLRQKGQLIGDADITIAAYCIVNDYTLVTSNTKDFIRIDGLKFVDWKD